MGGLICGDAARSGVSMPGGGGGAPARDALSGIGNVFGVTSPYCFLQLQVPNQVHHDMVPYLLISDTTLRTLTALKIRESNHMHSMPAHLIKDARVDHGWSLGCQALQHS